MNAATRNRRIAATLTLAVGIAATVGSSADDTRPTLRYGITAGSVEGANPSDVGAASRLWANGLAEAVGLYRDAVATVFQGPEDAVRAMNSGGLDLLAISTLEYLAVEDRIDCSPAMVWSKDDAVLEEYVLLARRDASRPPMPGRAIVVYAASRAWAPSAIWTELAMRELPPVGAARAPAPVKVVGKRGHAAMAVFFGQADYAVEAGRAFETAVTLNPQLGAQLDVVARSPGILPGLVCLSNRMEAGLRQRYVERATRLHEMTRYRQAFTVLQMTRLVPWDSRYLASARALVAEHAQRQQGR